MHDAAPIKWNDALLTGVAEIDQQHRILLGILTEAKACRATGYQFERITRELLAYAIYHFDTEETLMRRAGYDIASPDEFADHLARHRDFSERLVALRAQARLGNTEAQAALLPFLEDWLIKHIRTTDQGMGQFICSTTPQSR